MSDLKWLILILIGIWIIWFVYGGARSDAAKSGPFIKPPAPIDSGQIYGPQPAQHNQGQPTQ